MELRSNGNVTFEPLTHSYICGGRLLVGVTSLMRKHGLSVDYSGASEKVLARAAERGTAVHRMLEDYDNGRPPVLGDVTSEDGRVLVPQETMVKILKNYSALGLRILASEYLVSDDEMVASSIDKVAETDGSDEVDLLDVKTTSTLHKDALSVQLGIYSHLFRLQNPGLRVRNLYGVHVDVKTGRVRLVKVEPWPEENVKALLLAEREGRIYEGGGKPPETAISAVLTDAEVSAYVRNVASLQAAEKAANAAKKAISELQSRMAAWMEENGVDSLRVEGGHVRLKKSYVRTSVDAARLKAEMPDVYGRFLKESTVAASASFVQDNE